MEMICDHPEHDVAPLPSAVGCRACAARLELPTLADCFHKAVSDEEFSKKYDETLTKVLAAFNVTRFRHFTVDAGRCAKWEDVLGATDGCIPPVSLFPRSLWTQVLCVRAYVPESMFSLCFGMLRSLAPQASRSCSLVHRAH